MTVTVRSARTFPVEIPFSTPVTLAGTRHAVRRVILLAAEASDGTIGWGEAAPLPGFSTESLREVEAELAIACRALAGAVVDMNDPLAAAPLVRAASARMAVEWALVDLAARVQRVSAGRILNPDARPSQPVNAVLLPGESAERLLQAGFTTVKLKVGGAPDAAADRVRQVHREHGEKLQLRLDANRSFSGTDAIAFADRIADIPIDYLEEPTADFDAWDAVAERIPVAFDESLSGRSPGVFDGRRAAAVVLKPTVLGGVRAVRKWAEEAGRCGFRVTVGGAFETDVGLFAAAAIAAATGSAPAGLDTARYLVRRTTRPAFSVAGGSVFLPAASDVEVEP